jgi:short-subunit dehydrogenase
VFGIARSEERVPAVADAALHFKAGDPYTFQQAQMAIAQRVETVDWMVYAAGFTQPISLQKTTPEQWSAILDANLTGAQWATQVCMDLMTSQAHLLYTGVFLDKIMLPRMGAYVAAKAGLEAWTQILAKENRKLRITHAQLPAVQTSFWQNVPFKAPAHALSPEQVAEALIAWHESGQSGTLAIEANH